MASYELTPEQRTERDAAICRYYAEGHKIVECAAKFGLGRQRVHQILKASKVWKPIERRSMRSAFIGINVSEDVKAKLIAAARRRGNSLSLFASKVLEAVANHKDILK
jgi:transposase